MKKRLIPIVILTAYSAFLVRIMVLRDIPTIKIGHLMFRFGGADANGRANFVPGKTIFMYLFGHTGWVISSVNLLGNIALLVPVGVLLPFVFRNMTWKKSLSVLGIAIGLLIEGMQVVFNLGIFDIDDVILNAFGVVVGYFVYVIFTKWRHRNFHYN